jgi:hypothetical protein
MGSPRFVLTIFVIMQVADGLITFAAVRLFGPGAEANPVLQTWMHLLGPGVTLVTAKTVACAGAVLLYSAGRERTLVVLTSLVVSLGVGPWLAVLRDFSQ